MKGLFARSLPLLAGAAWLLSVLPAAEAGEAPTTVEPALVAPASTGTAAGPQAPGDAVSTRELEAAALYRLGLFQMGNGDFARARVTFDRVVREYAGTPSAEAASKRLEDLSATEGLPAGQKSRHQEALANSGRAEFVVTQTMVGGYIGLMIPLLAEADEGNAYVGGVLLGTLGGLGASLLISKKYPINSAQAAMIYYSQIFATSNTTLWYLTLANDVDGEDIPKASLLGLGLGTAAGAYLATKYPNLPEGRVSLVASAGIWTPLLTELALATLFEESLDERVYLAAAPLSADVAILATTLLASHYDFKISRSRMRLINLGGVVGGIVGGGVAFLTEVEFPAAGLMLLAGAGGGLVTGALATRDWDRTYHPELFAQTPTNSVFALENGRLKMGSPVPSISWTKPTPGFGAETRTKRLPDVSLSLVSGRF